MKTKPILFNTEMVRAILDGRKTVTRRLVKPQPGFFYDVGGRIPDPDNPEHIAFLAMDPDDHEEIRVPPFQPGDILYVRETWCDPTFDQDGWPILYKADMPMHWDADDVEFGQEVTLKAEDFTWRPSIHMPKEYARIFLRVKDVRAERLQDISADECPSEGVWPLANCVLSDRERYYKGAFAELWDSTIKPANLPAYGWDANPWVFVIEFERISKEEATK